MPKGNCKFAGCSGEAVGKGYCTRHYKQWRKGDLPKGRYKICTAEGCRKPRAVGSKCEEHGKAKPAGGEAAPVATA
jgi:hypothetical protein